MKNRSQIAVKLVHSLCFLLFLGFLISCATERPEGKTEAEVIFKEAKELKEDKHYLLATEKLNMIRSQFPYSYYATWAELLQADILFEQEAFVEAAAAYTLFRDFHPKHEKIIYVVWRIAESHYMQLPDTFDRDLSPAYEATKYFEELIYKYPKSEYVAKAQENIKNANEMLKKKEKYIADFYYKTEVYRAARYRYVDILKRPLFDQGLKDYYVERALMSSLLLKDKALCLQDYSILNTEVSPDKKSNISNIKSQCEQLPDKEEEDEA
ncbi:MAG: outer membrane protein assembly factor BamD [Bacteriovoracaceae bacterium]